MFTTTQLFIAYGAGFIVSLYICFLMEAREKNNKHKTESMESSIVLSVLWPLVLIALTIGGTLMLIKKLAEKHSDSL